MTALEFRDPPPPKKARRNWQAIADQLKARPGRWAVVASGSRSTVANIVSRINRNDYKVFAPVGAFKAECRESEKTPGQFEAFAKFVGHVDGLS
jgi:hypothetical protein